MEVLKIKYVNIMQHRLLITLHKSNYVIPELKDEVNLNTILYVSSNSLSLLMRYQLLSSSLSTCVWLSDMLRVKCIILQIYSCYDVHKDRFCYGSKCA